MIITCRKLLLAVAIGFPMGGSACPCVDTAVVRIDPENRQLVATISETSRVMVTAGLWELLMTDIRPHHSDWLGHWRVSFFTSAAAASSATRDPSSHVADYDRALNRLILWPDLDEQREEIALEIK